MHRHNGYDFESAARCPYCALEEKPFFAAEKPRFRRTKFGLGIGGWLFAALIGLDQFGNALLGGDPDMTISTRCGMEIRDNVAGVGCKSVCWALDLIDTNHCEEAAE